MIKKINFIVADKSFEKFYMHVILGTTGAALDIEMNFFFTFWGLFLLKKGYKTRVSGMMHPFKKMATWMFKKRLKGFGYGDVWDLVKDGVEEGKIHLYPCSMTLDMMKPMLKRDQLLDICEEPLGAAKFLEICDGADAIISL